MDTVSIEVRPRFTAGSAVAKKIRRAGLLPAIMYGKGTEARLLAADPKAVTRALTGPYGRNQLFEVSVKGEEGTVLAIAREIQIQPVSRRLTHADFMVVQPDTTITVDLPVRLQGRSAGEKVGGRVNWPRRFVVVSCTPETLPTSIDIEMAPLDIGDSLGVEDLKFPEGVKPIYKKAYKILEVMQPKGEDEFDDEEGEGEEVAAAESEEE